MHNIKEYTEHFNLKNFLKIILFPISSCITNPIIFYKTIKNLKVLLNGQWSQYSRLSAFRSLNSSWHRNYDHFLEKYGKKGYAYTMGLGNHISIRFHFTKISSRIYKSIETLTPILGCYFNFLLYFLFHELLELQIESYIVLILTLFSSLFYVNAFEAIKYDVLGWVFVPMAYTSFILDYPILLSISYLLIALNSISVLIPVSISFILLCILNKPLFLICFIPGGLYFLYMLYPMLKDINELKVISTGLGISSKGKKVRKLSLGVNGLYYILIWIPYSLYSFFFWTRPESISENTHIILLLLPTLLFIINKSISRFADHQTLFMMVLNSFFLLTILNPDIILIILFWIGINPTPALQGYAGEDPEKLAGILPVRSPYKISKAQEVVNHFLSKITSHNRILFYFNFQPNSYFDFDGYKSVKEFLNYTQMDKCVHTFPDQYTWIEYLSGKFPIEDIYGDLSIEAVKKGMKLIGAKYLIVPSQSFSIDKRWFESGFQQINYLDLNKIISKNDTGKKVFPKESPYFILLSSDDNNTIFENCIIRDIQPNLIKLTTTSKVSVIKYTYNKNWTTNNPKVTITPNSKYGWLTINAPKNEEVELFYEEK